MTADNLGNLPEFTVSEISQAVKRTLEGAFERVRVRGEISGFKRAASGHLYFALKDEEAKLDAVCWRGTAGRLAIKPEDGLEVIATGRISSYPGRSSYQLVVESLEPAGEGALLKLLEERRRRLGAEGLFDPERKRKLPFLPEVIGVVTSPTGAVIRDILHRLADRFPRHVLLWPVLVQGEGAKEQIAAAIAGFNGIAPGGPIPRPDLLIVARGGGSLEDLWAFNEEIVVRAAAASEIPLIAAVGHETDTTLIDFAADVRAPTPTAAAEMAVPVRAELLADVMQDGARIARAMARLVEEARLRVEALARGLPRPSQLVAEKAQGLDGWVERLVNARLGYFERRRETLARLFASLRTPGQQIEAQRLTLAHAGQRLAAAMAALQKDKVQGLALARLDGTRLGQLLARARERLEGLGFLLESLSYERVLGRGYALVRDAAGHAVTSAAGVVPGAALEIEFRDGRLRATADGGPEPAPTRKRLEPKKSQGSLF
ncbi:MAG TPA: exodeoxyribonuclease VII large subunit [Candidatus Udaeobacter sp.]|nr:exodeoxyribonuclease VII large subunit [Candidatus Udaeobacter sp.]